uniref:Uncharacterized protein n=1 Tax=Strigamia maritima TaxID=126957 RepID=T1J749_STRMM
MLNVKSVLLIYDKEFLSHAFLKWPYRIALKSMHVSDSNNPYYMHFFQAFQSPFNFNVFHMQYLKHSNCIAKSHLQISCTETNCVSNVISTQIIPSRHNISIGIFPYVPAATVIKQYDNGTRLFKGLYYDIVISYLCPILNLRVIEVYGDQLTNEVIYEMIIKKEVDTSVSPYGMTSDRIPYLDSTALNMQTDYFGIAIRDESQVENFLWSTFINPLSLQMWICSLTLSLVLQFIIDAINATKRLKIIVINNLNNSVKIFSF